MNEETILAIIKAIFNTVEPIIIADIKPSVIDWLNKEIELVTTDISKEKIALLHATLGNGLLRDNAKLAGYELELAGMNWALAQIEAYTPATA